MARPQILGADGKPYRRAAMRASVEAVKLSDENRRHWVNSDALSADAAFDPATRAIARNRSRYETLNNCYAKGSVRSGSNDMIGTGPRLQLINPRGDQARKIEQSYQRWSDEVHHAIHLRILQKSYLRDGGAFGVFDTAEDLRHPVKLYIRWLEDDHCQTPWNMVNDETMVDGIQFDRLGRPVRYWFLQAHPGGLHFSLTALRGKYFSVPAKNVLHWYPKDRFGQHRGIPDMTPALPIFSQLRRLTLATLTAAEFAACIAGVMKTVKPEQDPLSDPQGPSDAVPVPTFELIEMVRGALLTLPDGYEASQMASEHPNSTYDSFKRELLNEVGRSVGQPLNVVSGNSSLYNFSSGRLDHLPYQRGQKIDRNDLRILVQDRVLMTWAEEAILADEACRGAPPVEEWRWGWNWDGFDSIDQNKDAQADDMRLKNGTQTYAETYAAHGQDWEEQLRQIAEEKKKFEELGLPYPPATQPAMGGAKPVQQEDDPDVEEIVETAAIEAGLAPVVINRLMESLQPTFDHLRRRGARFTSNGKH